MSSTDRRSEAAAPADARVAPHAGAHASSSVSAATAAVALTAVPSRRDGAIAHRAARRAAARRGAPCAAHGGGVWRRPHCPVHVAVTECGRNIAHPIRHTAANPQRQASHPAQFPARALQRTPPRWMSRGLRWAPAPAPGSHPPGTPIFGCRWRTAAAVLVLPQPGARARCRAGRARRHEEALIRNHPTGRNRARAIRARGTARL